MSAKNCLQASLPSNVLVVNKVDLETWLSIPGLNGVAQLLVLFLQTTLNTK